MLLKLLSTDKFWGDSEVIIIKITPQNKTAFLFP